MKQLFILSFIIYIPTIMGMELTTPPSTPETRKFRHLRTASSDLNSSHAFYTEYQKARSILSLLLAQIELDSFLIYFNAQPLRNGKNFDWTQIKKEFDAKIYLVKAKKYINQEPLDFEDEFTFLGHYISYLPEVLPSAFEANRQFLLNLLHKHTSTIEQMDEQSWQRTWLLLLQNCMKNIEELPDQKVISHLANLIANYQLLSLEPEASSELKPGTLFELPTNNIITTEIRTEETLARA